MNVGALKPTPTTKVSAEANLEALGLVISTFSKNFLNAHIKEFVSVDLKIFVTKYPPSFKKSQASFKDANTN